MAKVDDPQNVEPNLRVLASLPGQKSGAKVNCDASTGRLSIGNWALFRSDSDSVTSREFADRFKALFRKAYRDREKYSTQCANALVGLQWLQKNSYANEPAKQKSLQKVLDEIAILKREADEREASWRIQEAQLIRDLRLGDVAMLDPALERFCQAVFDQRELMGAYLPGSSVAPADVAGLIYNLYVGLDPRAKAVRAEVREWKEWNRALYLAVSGKCPPRQPHFMGTNASLEDLVNGFCGGDYAGWCQHWIYFSLKPRGARIDFRVYANVTNGYARAMAGFLLDNKDRYGIMDFKFAGVAEMGQRADTAVIYCSDRSNAERLADNLATDPPKRGWFGNQVPGLTHKRSDVVGIALGAEPGHGIPELDRTSGPTPAEGWDMRRKLPLATGFTKRAGSARDFAAQKQEERHKSFGSHRSELIAMAICNYTENRHLDCFREVEAREAFKRFVAAAFRAYGMDPRNSWVETAGWTAR